jgi:hypothetical protein
MVLLKNNPIEMVCGAHAIPIESADPQVHLCIALGACISKSLRRYYAFNETTANPFVISIDRSFVDGNDSFDITINCGYDDFGDAVKFAESLSIDCYVSKCLRQKKVFKINCNMQSHTFTIT